MQIKMHEKYRSFPQEMQEIISIQNFFCSIGYISKLNNSFVEFRVSTLKDIVNIIIPHFNKYPLTKKYYYYYILFNQINLLY
jgi:LAGLIDADG endonuclease